MTTSMSGSLQLTTRVQGFNERIVQVMVLVSEVQEVHHGKTKWFHECLFHVTISLQPIPDAFIRIYLPYLRS